MAYPPGMGQHGSGWRIKKRVPTALLQHYDHHKFLHFRTGETDKKAAAVLAWRWLADLEEEFKRIRETGSKFKQVISPEEVDHLVRLMVRSALGAHEESRDAGDYTDDSLFHASLQYLQQAEDENRAALSRGLLKGDLPAIVQNWLTGHGYDIPEDGEAFRGICLAFAKGRAEAVQARRERNEGRWVDTPPPPVLVPVQSSSNIPRLSEVTQNFLGKQDKAAPMFKKFTVSMDLLLEVLGDRPVDALRQKEVDDFFALLCRLPLRWKDKKRVTGKSVVELAAMDWPECINKKTFDDSYMASLRPFFMDAARVFGDAGWPRHLTTKGIKYSGKREGGEKKQRAMRPDELKRLFEGPEYAGFAEDPDKEHCYWLPLIGLYTGARVNEVCQLNPQCDIREEEGVWFFDITEESDTDDRVRKSVKNKPSKRRTPIHSALLARGFLDYVQRVKGQGHALLFPQWPPTRGKASGKVEKWYRGLLETLGLRDETPGKTILGFHCMRSTFLSRADHLDIPNPGTLTGHKQGDGNRDEDGYKAAIALGKNRDKMELMHYEVCIPPLSSRET